MQTAQKQIQPTMEQYVYERYFQQVTRRDFHQSGLLLQYARERQTTPHLLWQSFMQHIQNFNLDNTLANLIEYLTVTAKQSEGKLVNYIYVNNGAASCHSYGIVNKGSQELGGAIFNQGFENSNRNNVHVLTNFASNQYEYDTHMSGSNQQDYELFISNGDNLDVLNNGMDSHVFSRANVNIVASQNLNLLSATSTSPYHAVAVTENFNNRCDQTKITKKFERVPPYTYSDFLRIKRDAEKMFEKILREEERKMAEDERKKSILRSIQEMLS